MRLLRPLPWALAALAVALAPLRASPGDDGPFGRPWYLGAGLVVAAALGATLLLTRTAGFRGAAGSRRRGVAFVGLLLVSYLAFVSNGAYLVTGDSLPQRAIPLALLNGDGMDLAGVVPREFRDHYAFTHRDGRLLSSYPVGTGLVALPYYAVARAVSRLDDRALFRSERIEKHAAALLATLSVALFFVAARRWSRFAHRLAAAAILALTTQWLPTTGQALWSFTGAAVLGTAALALGAVRRRGAPIAAGAALGAALLARPTSAVWLPLVGGLAPASRRRRLALGASFAVCGLAVAAFLVALYGSPFGAYADIQQEVVARGAQPFLVRLAGVLASPSRGLLWFFPALLVATPLALSGSRSPRTRRAARAACASAALVVLVNAGWPAWWGGHGLGPRLLTELSIPFAVLAGLALARRGRPAARGALIALLAFQGLVSFALAHSENARRWNLEALVGRPPYADLWSFRNGQLLASLWPGWSWRPSTSYLHPMVDASWEPLDLSTAANTSYLGDEVAGAPPHPKLPRLAKALSTPGETSGFAFLPPGPVSSVRVCAGESSAAVAMPPGRARRLATVMVWAPDRRIAPGRLVGEFVLRGADGERRTIPLRADRELIASDPELRSRPPARERLAAGRPADADALIVQWLRVPAGLRDARTVALEVSPTAAGNCLYWLAAAADPPRSRRTR